MISTYFIVARWMGLDFSLFPFLQCPSPSPDIPMWLFFQIESSLSYQIIADFAVCRESKFEEIVEVQHVQLTIDWNCSRSKIREQSITVGFCWLKFVWIVSTCTADIHYKESNRMTCYSVEPRTVMWNFSNGTCTLKIQYANHAKSS